MACRCKVVLYGIHIFIPTILWCVIEALDRRDADWDSEITPRVSLILLTVSIHGLILDEFRGCCWTRFNGSFAFCFLFESKSTSEHLGSKKG